MKIGILTFWTSQDNYGQFLQCYALQKYLKNEGHDAYLVRYAPTSKGVISKLCRCLSLPTLWSYLKSRKQVRKARKFHQAHPRFFSEFLREHITATNQVFHSLSDLQKNPPEADVYIVGSDQVWNHSIGLNDFGRGWFLDFGKESTKRISYAASFGMKVLPEDYRNFFAPILARFDAVSVREFEGVEFCAQMGYDKAVHVCDPTLLLTKEDYCSIISENTLSDKRKSLVCYMLGHKCDFPKEALDAFVVKNDLDFHYIPSQGAERHAYYEKFETPTIQEWLRLYRDADYIVTNSFHGTVFAILMRKKFIALPLSGKSSAMNGRLGSLLADLGLPSRLWNGQSDFSMAIVEDICWEEIELRVLSIRDNGVKFLQKVL